MLPMTISNLLISADFPQIEAEILISEAIHKNRSFVLAHPEYELKPTELATVQDYFLRRQQNDPIHYIIGHREFYGLDFKVTPDTLIPRPETEDLIDEVETFLKGKGIETPRILELGTGSGAVAIILAKKFSKAAVIATDISEAALKTAQENAQRLGANVQFKLGDLLEPVVDHHFDVIAANMPYIPQYVYDQLEPHIKDFEPKTALLGGDTGMEIYERLFAQIDQKMLGTPLFYEVDGRIYQKN
jgi:release factor glutamine methyltransferase